MSQARGERPRRGDVSRRQERAHRILDAAGELVLRWGYDKTTIDDVARAAGVAKGTIYLHWHTRDALFGALLRRERVAMLEEVRRGVGDDPDGATLRGLLRNVARAFTRCPLLRALFLGDVEVLGRLARQKPGGETTAELRSGFGTYLAALREQGLVRTDLSMSDQINIVIATLYGFFFAMPLMPDGYRLPDERLADLLAETAHRALESGRPVSSDEAEAISRATIAYVDMAVEVAREKLRRSMSPDTSGEERAS